MVYTVQPAWYEGMHSQALSFYSLLQCSNQIQTLVVCLVVIVPEKAFTCLCMIIKKKLIKQKNFT